MSRKHIEYMLQQGKIKFEHGQFLDTYNQYVYDISCAILSEGGGGA